MSGLIFITYFVEVFFVLVLLLLSGWQNTLLLQLVQKGDVHVLPHCTWKIQGYCLRWRCCILLSGMPQTRRSGNWKQWKKGISPLLGESNFLDSLFLINFRFGSQDFMTKNENGTQVPILSANPRINTHYGMSSWSEVMMDRLPSSTYTSPAWIRMGRPHTSSTNHSIHIFAPMTSSFSNLNLTLGPPPKRLTIDWRWLVWSNSCSVLSSCASSSLLAPKAMRIKATCSWVTVAVECVTVRWQMKSQRYASFFCIDIDKAHVMFSSSKWSCAEASCHSLVVAQSSSWPAAGLPSLRIRLRVFKQLSFGKSYSVFLLCC